MEKLMNYQDINSSTPNQILKITDQDNSMQNGKANELSGYQQLYTESNLKNYRPRQQHANNFLEKHSYVKLSLIIIYNVSSAS